MVNPALAADARSALGTYLGLLDTALPGASHGIYLTGSAALGDWRSRRSDLDILTVTTCHLDDSDLDALAGLHAKAAGRPYLDAIYAHRDGLGQDPRRGSPAIPYTVDGVFHRAGYRPDPVLWATLDRHGLTVRGPAAADLGVSPDPQWLRDWNLGNLSSYWRPWAASARARLADRDPNSPLPADVVAWAVLGPGRLHYTIVTGGIISKTAAADYTAQHFPGHAELSARTKAWRLGDEASTFTTADGLAACDLIDAIIDDTAQLQRVLQ